MNKYLKIIDFGYEKYAENIDCYFWYRKENENNILKFIDENVQILRNEYIKIIWEISQYNINDKKIFDHLQFREQYNLWTMSLIAEKCPIKSTEISEVIKLIALKKLLKDKSYSKIRLYSSNSQLINAISILSNNKKIKLEIINQNIRKIKTKRFKDKLKVIVPFYFRANYLIFKRYISNLNLRKYNQQQKNIGKSILIVSYFLHIDIEQFEKKQFYSHQWKMIPDLLNKHGYNINWVHHYLNESPKITYKNISSIVDGKHFLIEGYINIRLILKTILNFNYFYFKNLAALKISRIFGQNQSINFLLDYFRESWYSSFFGSHLANNILYTYLFEKIANEFNKSEFVLFLQENQGWEKALIASWQTESTNKIVGVAPTIIKEWDLRYFEDINVYKNFEAFDKISPNLILVNGQLSYDNLINNNFPPNKVRGVEAYRYFDSVIKKNETSKFSSKNNKVNKILLIGEYDEESTMSMIKAVKNIKNDAEFYFRPHPGKIISKTYLEKINVISVSRKISDIFQEEFDLVISVGSTSAALDAYLNNIPVIIYIKNSLLNLSPLYGKENVIFVGSENELRIAILNEYGKDKNEIHSSTDDIFWMDTDLKRWKKFLGSMSENP